jgi:leader peptidase (prepilin peptidase)/N-methyltransferase
MTGLPSEIAAGLITAWWGAVGTVIGSFLNVVVYRLPIGMSIVRPGSHCPVCKTPIRWYDNVPVLGWLLLAGRCRHCRQAISPRYPLVEGLVGLMFLAVAWVDCYVSGTGVGFGPRMIGALRTPAVLGLCLYHVALLCTILAAALIEFDGHRVPVPLAGFGLVVSLAGFELLPLAEALFITAAVGWYLLVRPSLTRQSLLGLPPTAWLGLAMLAWVVLRPIWI